MNKENKKEDRYLASVAQKAIIYDPREQKYLLIKSSRPNEYFLENYGEWEFPGGKLEGGESLEEGILREIKEEIGEIELDFVGPVSNKKLLLKHGWMIMLDYFYLYRGGGIELSDEHKEFRWETAENIQKSQEYYDWIKKLISRAEKYYVKPGEYLAGWKRCQADFENYKRRQTEEKKDTIAYSNLRLILELLPVIDNFQASTGHIPENEKDSPWVTGIMYIQKQLEKVLEDNGVSEIVIKPGDKFDPATMEAIENKETKKDKPGENRVGKVLAKGYRMGERVVRAARVTVE